MSKKINLYMYPMKKYDILKKRNPYLFNLSNSLSKEVNIVNYAMQNRGGVLDSYFYLFKADYFYFNWIENIGKFQFFLFRVLYILIRLLGKKVIWTHHNAEPHITGSDIDGKKIINFIKKRADFVIAHTRESYELLNLNSSKILFFFHPFFSTDVKSPSYSTKKTYDILVWGNMRKSKGIHDFLRYLKDHELLDKYSIKILGKFESISYYDDVATNFRGLNIDIENRFVDNVELDYLHSVSKFIFFPYTGPSVLNSGALVTSLPKGTQIIGPLVGAFKDLGNLGLIYNYKEFSDVIAYLDDNLSASHYEFQKLKEFCLNHTWERFAAFVREHLD